MSILARLMAWLGRSLPATRPAPCPDQLPLRDWADLPAHHPRCE